jgi:hypothetical protein
MASGSGAAVGLRQHEMETARGEQQVAESTGGGLIIEEVAQHLHSIMFIESQENLCDSM